MLGFGVGKSNWNGSIKYGQKIYFSDVALKDELIFVEYQSTRYNHLSVSANAGIRVL